MNNQIDHSVLNQEFRSLKACREFLADRLFDDTRSGKTDERAGSAMLRSPSIAKLA